jgi:hypothetical protein
LADIDITRRTTQADAATTTRARYRDSPSY